MLYGKYIIFITFISLLSLPLNTSLAHTLNYKAQIGNSANIVEKNTVYNIEKAKLLKNYVDSLQKEISDFKRDHYVQNEQLDNKSFELKIMSQSLSKVLTINIEKHHSESIYESIIEEMKSLKTEISTTLKKELTSSLIKLAQNKQEKDKKALIVSQKFTSFVNIFTPKVRNLQNTEKRRLILNSIGAINTEASKLALFSTKKFNSQRQLDEYYSNSLRTIKRELQKIQAVIVNK